MTTEEIPLDAPLAQRIADAVERYGVQRVIGMAVGLLEGRNEGDDILLYLGGRHARGVLDGAPPLYWPELWGARALSVVWPDAEPDSATSAVLAGLGNQAWRVREMCAKVCAAHGVGDTGSLSAVLTDEVPRVRSAAARALAEIGTAEQMDAIKALLKDADKDVRRAAQQSLDRLRDRTRPAAD
jgi:hypothetical protein